MFVWSIWCPLHLLAPFYRLFIPIIMNSSILQNLSLPKGRLWTRWHLFPSCCTATTLPSLSLVVYRQIQQYCKYWQTYFVCEIRRVLDSGTPCGRRVNREVCEMKKAWGIWAFDVRVMQGVIKMRVVLRDAGQLRLCCVPLRREYWICYPVFWLRVVASCPRMRLP